MDTSRRHAVGDRLGENVPLHSGELQGTCLFCITHSHLVLVVAVSPRCRFDVNVPNVPFVWLQPTHFDLIDLPTGDEAKEQSFCCCCCCSEQFFLVPAENNKMCIITKSV